MIISGVGLYWFVYHFYNAQYVFETLNNDLLWISTKINSNCDANYYSFSYNPETETGTLLIKERKICIRSNSIEKCAALECGPLKDANIDLEKITSISGELDGNLEIAWN